MLHSLRRCSQHAIEIMSTIKDVTARSIFDSRGNPTIEVSLGNNGKVSARCILLLWLGKRSMGHMILFEEMGVQKE